MVTIVIKGNVEIEFDGDTRIIIKGSNEPVNDAHRPIRADQVIKQINESELGLAVTDTEIHVLNERSSAEYDLSSDMPPSPKDASKSGISNHPHYTPKKKSCVSCGIEFQPRSNNTKFFPECTTKRIHKKVSKKETKRAIPEIRLDGSSPIRPKPKPLPEQFSRPIEGPYSPF